jgi:mRNA interferase RelE/StbE
VTYTVVWENHAMDEFRRLRALDPVGAKATAVAVRALADDPRPDAARALGTSGYYRLHV